MSYKRFFLGSLGLVYFIMFIKILLTWLIDPLGIWDVLVVRGFNHYKINQWLYLDVSKPYEYMREKPDILYIGASKIRVGFEPITLCSEKKVYNMGMGALSLRYMKEYLRFAYKSHRPEIVYMGLMPEDFEKCMQNDDRAGYSQERLERLSGNWGSYWSQLLDDCLGIPYDIYWSTITASQTHEENGPLFLHGWDVTPGSASVVNEEAYYKSMWWSPLDPIHRQWEDVPEAIGYLQQIAEDAQEAGVQLVVFFPPHSVDCYLVMDIMGCLSDYQQAKREAVQVLPIYDFAVINELTTNREAYFYDAVHFRTSMGVKLQSCLENGNPNPYGYLLTPENIDAVLATENAAWEKWKAENREYVDVMRKCIKAGREPQVGDFKKYIGF